MKKYYKVIIFFTGLVVGIAIREILRLSTSILLWGIGVIIAIIAIRYFKDKKSAHK